MTKNMTSAASATRIKQPSQRLVPKLHCSSTTHTRYEVYRLLAARQAVLSSTTTEGATNPERIGGPDTPLQNATLETPAFMPKLLLVLSSATSSSSYYDGSSAASEGRNSQLLLSVMEALDACEAVPPAIVSCPSPSTWREGGHRVSGQK